MHHTGRCALTRCRRRRQGRCTRVSPGDGRDPLHITRTGGRGTSALIQRCSRTVAATQQNSEPLRRGQRAAELMKSWRFVPDRTCSVLVWGGGGHCAVGWLDPSSSRKLGCLQCPAIAVPPQALHRASTPCAGRSAAGCLVLEEHDFLVCSHKTAATAHTPSLWLPTAWPFAGSLEVAIAIQVDTLRTGILCGNPLRARIARAIG